MTNSSIEVNRLLGSEHTLLVCPYGAPAPLRRIWAGQSVLLLAGGPSAATHLQKIEAKKPLLMTVNNMWSKIQPDAWVCVDSPSRFHASGWKSPRIMKFSPTVNANVRLKEYCGCKEKILALSPASAPNSWFYRHSVGFDANTFFTQTSICIGNSNKSVGADGQTGGRSVMLAAIRVARLLGANGVYIVGMDLHMENNNPYAFKAFKHGPKEHYVKHWNNQAATLSKRLASLVKPAAKINFNMRMVGKGPLPECTLDEAIIACTVSTPVGANVEGLYGWEKKDGTTN